MDKDGSLLEWMYRIGAGIWAPPRTQRGLYSNTMALITSGCAAMRLSAHQMALITSGRAALQASRWSGPSSPCAPHPPPCKPLLLQCDAALARGGALASGPRTAATGQRPTKEMMQPCAHRPPTRHHLFGPGITQPKRRCSPVCSPSTHMRQSPSLWCRGPPGPTHRQQDRARPVQPVGPAGRQVTLSSRPLTARAPYGGSLPQLLG